MDLVGRRGGRATAARRRLFEFVVAGGFAYGFGASVKPRRWRGSVKEVQSWMISGEGVAPGWVEFRKIFVGR